VFVCQLAGPKDEAPSVRKILSTEARRAYRRPVRNDDVERLLVFCQVGRKQGGFEAGIEMVVRRLLAAPEFLFRVEDEPANVAPGANYRIGDFELASRLSFFL
jgi:hypothetical protein